MKWPSKLYMSQLVQVEEVGRVLLIALLHSDWVSGATLICVCVFGDSASQQGTCLLARWFLRHNLRLSRSEQAQPQSKHNLRASTTSEQAQPQSKHNLRASTTSEQAQPQSKHNLRASTTSEQGGF